jgi:hypothetical protein
MNLNIRYLASLLLKTDQRLKQIQFEAISLIHTHFKDFKTLTILCKRILTLRNNYIYDGLTDPAHFGIKCFLFICFLGRIQKLVVELRQTYMKVSTA